MGVHMQDGGFGCCGMAGLATPQALLAGRWGAAVFGVSCVIAAMTLLPHALATQFVFANGYDTAGKAARSCWRWYESCVR